MEEKNVLESNDSPAHPLQKPLNAIAASIIFSGILIAASIVATRVFPMPSAPGAGDAARDEKAAQPIGSLALSLGDDPVLGNKKKAKIAIVEFSDYECPFCKKFHNETFDVLKKEYIDTGKAVLVFKDFPLGSHEPMASKEAVAANCVQKITGDKAYFDYSAALYKNTAANGKGMADEKMIELAVAAGAQRDRFADCIVQNNFKDEIAQDVSDGDKAGITGTPAFVIGALGKDGSVTGGVKIVGAQPIENFRKAIDEQLKK